MKYLLIGLLRFYRFFISPLYGQVCRYHPTCSAYALEAVTVHGSIKGSWLAARRVASCHPWAEGGYDPVPGTGRDLVGHEPTDDGDTADPAADADAPAPERYVPHDCETSAASSDETQGA